ncbi:MAG TPA: ATP synthase F1 subunit delta [Gaiellaceae bacterium]|nr:ATP synthase F1 subunit delta [Gaiellaceae bacterium]
MAAVHRVYAEALLEAAGEKGRLAEVREDLAEFAGAVASTDELRSFLRNPQIDSHVKRDALAELLADADELVRNFLLLLTEKGRIAEITEIHAEFERLIAQEARVLELELTTAVELSDDEAAQLVRRFEDAAGRRVEATRRVDPDIIGGIVVQAGSRRLDASVRGRLDRLRQELTARR